MPKSVKCLSILEEECHKFVLISFSNAIIFCICGDKDTIFMDKHQTFLVKMCLCYGMMMRKVVIPCALS